MTLSEFDLYKQIPDFQADPQYPWLRDVPENLLRNGIKDTSIAYKNFFEGRTRYPTYRSKNQGESFRLTQNVRASTKLKPCRVQPPGEDAIRLSKLGWFTVYNSYPRLARKGLLHEGKIKRTSVKLDADGWWITLTCLVESSDSPKPILNVEQGGVAIGIDMGIKNSITLSTGESHNFLVATLKEQAHIARLKARVSRCQRGSHNRARARTRFRKYETRIKRRARHRMHEVSKRLVLEHDFIAREDLQIQQMGRSARGTIDRPGISIRAKTKLNRDIQAQSWGIFFRMLEYKGDWYGAHVQSVPAAYSSQECSKCGWTCRENRKSQAVFHCTNSACEHVVHADVNAAATIRSRGLTAVKDLIDTPESIWAEAVTAARLTLSQSSTSSSCTEQSQ